MGKRKRTNKKGDFMKIYNPLISVIIPVYKVENFLHRCVDSVINQTYKNLEIILIDDGSPDNCGNICDEYANKDTRIKVIHQENQGLSGARNSGLNIAKGEYIYFIDSDDYIKKNTFEDMINFSEFGKYDIVIGQMCYLYSGNKIKENKNLKYCNDIKKIRKNIFLAIISVSACSKLIKKHIFSSIKFPLNKLAEDLFVSYKILFVAQTACFIPETYYIYSKENSNSLSNGKNLKNIIFFKYGRFLSWIEHSKFAKKYYPDLEIYCIENALKNGIKAYIFNKIYSVFTKEDTNKIYCTLKEYKHIKLSKKQTIQRYFILNNWNFILNFLSFGNIFAFKIRTFFRILRWKKNNIKNKTF